MNAMGSRFVFRLCIAVLLGLSLGHCGATKPPQSAAEALPPPPPPPQQGPVLLTDLSETGEASYYGWDFNGRKTASGERFDMHAMTAAHRRLPFGSWVRVENLVNKRLIDVRINDRGPFAKGRIIDLSYVAAQALDLIRSGVGPVRVTPLLEVAQIAPPEPVPSPSPEKTDPLPEKERRKKSYPVRSRR